MTEVLPVVKILVIATVAFLVALFSTPLLTHFLYRYHLVKKIRDNGSAPIMSALHQGKQGTPTMGGMLVWVTVLFLVLVFFYLSEWGVVPEMFNFLSRAETLLPLGALVASAIVGLVDDWFNVRGWGPRGGGMQIRYKLIIYTLIAAVGAWWFYYKLDWTSLYLPVVGYIDIGWWYVPLFIFIIVATAFSVNEVDGLDGLAGGSLLAAFGAFGAIAFVLGKEDLAAFCAAIAGALLAFLWFNINPARFFMGDTGSMSLGVTLGIVAMLTNTVWLLPIIGLLLVLESLSVIIQILSKKFRGKKVFLSTPLHHHLEAIGWPEPKIVMRFWVISGVLAVVGIILFLVDRIA
ncbi:TPA: phospho-N-acetylmuramoyl-pentapeptide-transferase [Patescibacteria group bacterium]|nr:phospho-N-acetylmuramoyl-pentapeptide-transferase [Patescibacteria group bacterium]HCU47935.1 phospho-N-acetylmuramoyl-pentapeptide-transferase [Patescibacteria group bacterium]